jgi:hypothetical protein
LKHIVVPEPQSQTALRFERSSPLGILFATFGVLSAVEFNDQSRRLTAEVRDVVADCDLPAKFQAIQATVAQTKPQLSLGVGLIAPQLSSCGYN